MNKQKNKTFVVALFVFLMCVISLSTYLSMRTDIKTLKKEISKRDSIEMHIQHIEDVLMINFTDLDRVQAHGFARVLYENCDKYKIDWELVASIIYYESGYKCGAANPSGATGLMQLMPSTGQMMASRIGIERVTLTDPFINVALGSVYMATELKGKTLDNAIRTYVGDKTNTTVAVQYRGGVKADYNRMKRMR